MSEPLTPFEARMLADFLAEQWGVFWDFLGERDLSEREADQITGKLEFMAQADED